MLPRKIRPSFSALALLPWLLALGCSASATATPAQDAGSSASASAMASDTAGAAPLIQVIAARGTLSDLRAPNFTDYGKLVQDFYRSVNEMPVWVRTGQPTPQALSVITALESSRKKGLNPEDYDASLWAQRVITLKGGGAMRKTSQSSTWR